MVLLVRNKVKDFDVWKRVFDAQDAAASGSGLVLTNLWRSVDDPNEVFFTFDVQDRAAAEAYMSSPEAQAVGEQSGAIEGEVHFLAPVE